MNLNVDIVRNGKREASEKILRLKKKTPVFILTDCTVNSKLYKTTVHFEIFVRNAYKSTFL